jgi:hypothetical protein
MRGSLLSLCKLIALIDRSQKARLPPQQTDAIVDIPYPQLKLVLDVPWIIPTPLHGSYFNIFAHILHRAILIKTILYSASTEPPIECTRITSCLPTI